MKFKEYLRDYKFSEGIVDDAMDKIKDEPDESELNDEDRTGFEDNRIRNALSRIFGDNLEKLGAGNFSVVFSSPENSAEVIKVSNKVIDVKDDGYLHYINKIGKEIEENQNPYLPRVYDLEIYRGEEILPISGQPISRYHYTLKLERLHMFESKDYNAELYGDDSDNDPYSIANQLRIMVEKIYTEDGLGVFKERYNVTFNAFVRDLRKAITIEDFSIIKDKNLIRAIRVLREAGGALESAVGMALYDIYQQNIMFRRTPYGLQLVITDPLA